MTFEISNVNKGEVIIQTLTYRELCKDDRILLEVSRMSIRNMVKGLCMLFVPPPYPLAISCHKRISSPR